MRRRRRGVEGRGLGHRRPLFVGDPMRGLRILRHQCRRIQAVFHVGRIASTAWHDPNGRRRGARRSSKRHMPQGDTRAPVASLTDVAAQAGLSRGAILYYYEDLDAPAGRGACRRRRAVPRRARPTIAALADPRDRLAAAIDAGLPTGPDDALMSLLPTSSTCSPATPRCTTSSCRSSTCASSRRTPASSPPGAKRGPPRPRSPTRSSP